MRPSDSGFLLCSTENPVLLSKLRVLGLKRSLFFLLGSETYLHLLEYSDTNQWIAATSQSEKAWQRLYLCLMVASKMAV